MIEKVYIIILEGEVIGLKLKEAKDLCIKDPALKDPVVPHKNLHANHTRYDKY